MLVERSWEEPMIKKRKPQWRWWLCYYVTVAIQVILIDNMSTTTNTRKSEIQTKGYELIRLDIRR